MNVALDDRLLSVASFVRPGDAVIDVGTDHAYLPVYLLEAGIATRALATDINPGPLNNARETVAACGLENAISTALANGLDGAEDFEADTVMICGMGGELIADIIDRAPEMKDPAVRLILQPMTRRGSLASYLYKNGFEILSEAYSRDAGKYYVTLLVGYSGECREIDGLEAEFGSIATPCKNRAARLGYLRTRLAVLEKRRAGIGMSTTGGEDYTPHVEYVKKLIDLEERQEK